MRNLIISSLLMLNSIIVLGQSPLIALLPSENILNKWTIKDSAEVYSDEDLFMYINGGADVYLEYGFASVVTCRYINPAANNIRIEIYEMTDIDAAFGIFSLNSSGKGQPVELGNMAYRYDYYLDVWKKNFFIRCTVSRKDAGVMDTLQLFARSIDQKIENAGKVPQIIHLFDLNDIELSDLKFMRGQIALGNVFNFGHGSIAGFTEAISSKAGDTLLFAFGYKTDHDRREWYSSAKGKMQMNNKFTDYTALEDGFTVKDKNGATYSFKPYKQFFIVLKGLDWEGARPLFEEISGNIDKVYP